MKYNPKEHGYTGRMSEWDSISCVNKKDAYYDVFADWARLEAAQKMRTDFEKVQKPAISPENEKGTYLSFQHSLDLAKRFQDDDPLNPKKDLPRDLRLEVADLLGLTEDEDLERIKFYSSTDTPLDWYHGTDCFLEYVDKNGDAHMFRFDLTENKEKAEEEFNRKGAMIVSGLPDPQEETDAYLNKIHAIAEKVANQFHAEQRTPTA